MAMSEEKVRKVKRPEGERLADMASKFYVALDTARARYPLGATRKAKLEEIAMRIESIHGELREEYSL